MLRNALIAIYILAVLAISAISRAEIPGNKVFELKHQVEFVVDQAADPLPGIERLNPTSMKVLSIGNSGVNK